MKLHDLKSPVGSTHRRKIVGRGIAGKGGKTADHVIPSGTLRAYRERQREGDLFKVTEG